MINDITFESNCDYCLLLLLFLKMESYKNMKSHKGQKQLKIMARHKNNILPTQAPTLGRKKNKQIKFTNSKNIKIIKKREIYPSNTQGIKPPNKFSTFPKHTIINKKYN